MIEETCPTTPTIYDWARDPLNAINAKGWDAFALRYHERIIVWCRRNGLQESEAEDVTQDILLRIRDKIKLYEQEKGRFRNWLKIVTSNACKDAFRKAKTRRCQTFLDDVPICEDLEKVFDDQARTELLRIALADVQRQITPRDWGIFESATFRQIPAAILAKEHNLSVSAIHMIKFRIREKVKAKMKELGGVDDTMEIKND